MTDRPETNGVRHHSSQEVYTQVYSVAADLANKKYDRDVRAQIDLLCYVNFVDVMNLIETPLPAVIPLALLGYRSVSILEGHRSCILCSDQSAPSFLQVPPRVIHRNTPCTPLVNISQPKISRNKMD